MDRLTLLSTLLFLSCDVFAVAALVMPDWIVSHAEGTLRAVNESFNDMIMSRFPNRSFALLHHAARAS